MARYHRNGVFGIATESQVQLQDTLLRASAKEKDEYIYSKTTVGHCSGSLGRSPQFGRMNSSLGVHRSQATTLKVPADKSTTICTKAVRQQLDLHRDPTEISVAFDVEFSMMSLKGDWLKDSPSDLTSPLSLPRRQQSVLPSCRLDLKSRCHSALGL